MTYREWLQARMQITERTNKTAVFMVILAVCLVCALAYAAAQHGARP